ncbi:MAG: adaptor protein MecA [Oscillospiraceae bacterium]|nr:adaptor protein MecA [Oscillospiraceae bacterium]
MRIEAITRRKVIVELSAEDLAALDITYDALDYASIETRRVIWIILDRVRETTGCDIDPSGQLLIDAMPRPTGGCILFFTLRGGCAEPFSSGMPPERTLRKQEELELVFEFPGVDALLDCAGSYAQTCVAAHRRLIAASALYAKKEKYRLLLYPAQEMPKVQQFFSEFAKLCTEESYAADATREHWERVGDETAFAQLGGGACPANESGDCAELFRPGNVFVSV